MQTSSAFRLAVLLSVFLIGSAAVFGQAVQPSATNANVKLAESPAVPAVTEKMSLGAWIPPVDIWEDKERILLITELPGFKEGEFELQVDGSVLTLRGERRHEEEKAGRSYQRRERSYGQFVRSFTLPITVDLQNIKASFSGGLLEIEVAKREEVKPRQIKISGGEKQRGAIGVKPN